MTKKRDWFGLIIGYSLVGMGSRSGENKSDEYKRAFRKGFWDAWLALGIPFSLLILSIIFFLSVYGKYLF